MGSAKCWRRPEETDLVRWIIGALLLCSVSLASAGATESLVKLLDQLQSLQGRFEQVVLDHGGTRLQEARGDMALARGNRFNWHTQEPFEQLAVSDGKTLWIYDVDLEQVIEKPMGEKVANTPALLFGGEPARIADAFSVETLAAGKGQSAFRLRPKGGDPLFELLEVTFDGSKPVSMRLEDALGQQTSIDFHDVTVNGKLPSDLFLFEAPEGADVIRQGE